ncbi:MutS-related protein [Gilvimarinus sp. F26214L]|uniref:MutS-related protein n=1 Tax=Gilvimarinus sp. DZF01 TaxID=3461371 RepID=UPI004045C0C4
MDRPITNNNCSDFLGIDAHTFLELEIFESEEGKSVFEFCNLTRTKGGEAVLEKRMRHPWAKACQIRDTQCSVAYIIENRTLFDIVHEPGLRYVTGTIDTYMHAAVPVIAATNVFEFTFQAASLYVNDTNHFYTITRGVHLTQRLINTLCCFLDQPGLASPKGELAPLLEEAKALLFAGRLSEVGDEFPGRSQRNFWQVLRLDQLFRVTEAHRISRLLCLVYEVDALIAMADCTQKHDFILPTVKEGEMEVNAEGLVHPYVPDAVANPVNLNQQYRGVFLTGPNMAGKTTYLRAFATTLYLAHLGMGVPATRYCFVPVQQLISSISLSDNLHRGVSYFRAEALRVKDVVEAVIAGYRVVTIMDEPFKGTNVKDTLEASLGILSRFSAMSNLLFMFSSHQIELAEQLQGPIDFRCFAAIESEERLRFDYRLRPGVTTQRIGMRVLREEGVFDLLDQ